MSPRRRAFPVKAPHYRLPRLPPGLIRLRDAIPPREMKRENRESDLLHPLPAGLEPADFEGGDDQRDGHYQRRANCGISVNAKKQNVQEWTWCHLTDDREDVVHLQAAHSAAH
jgi:hypothetical protein